MFKVTLSHERDTKGTHVFKTEDTSAQVTQLYVKKGAFQGETPTSIEITVK